jgi:hypothetical protein
LCIPLFAGYTRFRLQLGGTFLDEILNLTNHLAPRGAASGFEAHVRTGGEIEAQPFGWLDRLCFDRSHDGHKRLPVMACPALFVGFDLVSR